MTLLLNASGLTINTVAEEQQAIASALALSFGQSLQTSNPNTAIASFIAAFADADVAVQEALLVAWAGMFPAGATGVQLDGLAQNVGLTRNIASQTLGTLNATNPTGALITVPQGALFTQSSTTDQYAAVSATAIGAGLTVSVAIRAVDTGPKTVGTGAFTVLTSFAGGSSLTPIVGTATSSQGSDQETDADLRLRLVSDGARAGRGTLASILAAVRDVDGVTRAAAYENTTLATGIASPVVIAGLPPKSFVVVVQGGANADVAAAIYDTAPAGIESYGDTTVSVDTGEGYNTPVLFERPAAVTIYVSATITGSSAAFNDACENAIIAYLETYPTTVLRNQILCAILDVVGRLANISSLTLGFTASPVGTSDLAIAWNEYPTATSVSIVLTFV
jgi:uncharacterized phage protein gp47/JayE